MKSRLPSSQSGQVLVEYVLLLIIVVSVASIIVGGMVGRSEDSPGVVIRAWTSILGTIAADLPEIVE